MESILFIILILFLVGFGTCFYFQYRHYERLLKKEVKRAQKSEQLKSAFIDNASRTMRTPLNAILGYSNMILEEQDETMQPEQVKEMARNIKKDSEDLIGFV
ncbi:MAG: hypothetical protein IKM77_01425, partial [Prevotella sp.]|nr:hypothetical protein [Prevotella sp.]